MRVKIYRQGCDVETHEIPQLAGKTVTRDGIDVDGTRVKCGTETESEVDDVADVIERFTFSPERGGFLERFVRRWEYVNGMWRHVDRGANGTRGMVVVAPDEVGSVTRIEVDDVQVWPEGEDGGRIAELEALVERLTAGAGA